MNVSPNYHIVYERPCGAKFCCGGVVLQTVIRDSMYGCKGCYYYDKADQKCSIRDYAREFVGHCERNLRTDRCDVKFIKIEDIPYATD